MNDKEKPAPDAPARLQPTVPRALAPHPPFAETPRPGPATTDADGPHARREGGPRRTIHDRVALYVGEEQFDGWTLNLSRGGLRAVIEASVEVGSELDVAIGESTARRPARVVWTRQERGGAVVGLAFLDRPDGSISDIPLPLPEPDHQNGGRE